MTKTLTKKHIATLIIGFILSTYSHVIFALDTIGLSLGEGRNADMKMVRLHVGWEPWMHYGQDSYLQLTNHIEVTTAFFGDTERDNGQENALMASIIPVFRITTPPIFGYIAPFIEGGIGASFFSQTRLDKKRISSSFQFEDRIGAGVRLGKNQSLEIRGNLIHHSNLGLKIPNNGINIAWIGLAWWF